MTRTLIFKRRGRDEAGASLILALVFILVTSVTVLSLTKLASNGLNNVAQFRAPQLERSALNSVMTTAVEEERFTVTPGSINNTNSAVLCASQVTIPESNQTYIFNVWCSATQNVESNTATRTVTFTACSSASTQICSSSPLLVTVVEFDDYPFLGAPILVPPNHCAPPNCGTAETVVSWVLS